MCLYSAYVRESQRRNAKVGEKLTVGEINKHVTLMGDDELVTCIKPGTTLAIDAIDFVGHYRYEFADYIGKPVTIKLLRGYGSHYTADRFELGDRYITIECLAKGVTACIPRKVRSDKGKTKPRNLEKVLGMDQVRADVPVDMDAQTAETQAEYDDYIREFARDEMAEKQ